MGKKNKKRGSNLMDFDLTPEEQIAMLSNFDKGIYVPTETIVDDELEEAVCERFGLMEETTLEEAEIAALLKASNTEEDEIKTEIQDVLDRISEIEIDLDNKTNMLGLAGANLYERMLIRLSSLEKFDNPINDDIDLLEQISNELIDTMITSLSPCCIIPYDTFKQSVLQIVSDIDDRRFKLYKARYYNTEYVLVYVINSESMDVFEDVIDKLIGDNKFLTFTDAMLHTLIDNKYVAYDFNRDFHGTINIDEDIMSDYINEILSNDDTKFYSGTETGIGRIPKYVKDLENVNFNYRPLIQGVIDKINGVEKVEEVAEKEEVSETESEND